MHMIRIGIFTLEEVLPFVFTSAKRHELKVKGYKYTDQAWIEASKKEYFITKNNKKYSIIVSVGSHRYQLFSLKGTDCLHCGIKGKFFALERSIGNSKTKFHFNLYGIDEQGEEVMITKDHILPRSKGGKNILSNYQPLCIRCNQQKADHVES